MRQLIGDVPLGGGPFPPIADPALLSDCETCPLVGKPAIDERPNQGAGA